MFVFVVGFGVASVDGAPIVVVMAPHEAPSAKKCNSIQEIQATPQDFVNSANCR
jgi:hypothetical protein